MTGIDLILQKSSKVQRALQRIACATEQKQVPQAKLGPVKTHTLACIHTVMPAALRSVAVKLELVGGSADLAAPAEQGLDSASLLARPFFLSGSHRLARWGYFAPGNVNFHQR
jgi:hypothetical protein